MEKVNLLNPTAPGVVALLSASAYTPDGIASRPLLQAPGVRMVWMGLDIGQELTEHSTPKRALVQILEGTCDFQLGTEWVRLNAGDMAHLTPGLAHAAKAITRTSFLLTLIPSSNILDATPDASVPGLSLTATDE